MKETPDSHTREDRRRLTEFIKGRTVSLGFDRVGVTRAGSLGSEGGLLRTWILRGYHGTMEWMRLREEERRDTGRYFPEGKSVVSAAINYYHGLARGPLKVSNYAWGDDYHRVLKEKLRRLLTEIRQMFPDVRGMVCVDTSPVMEKAWAQRAGIGWLGKHTNIITRDFGSWVFLGELILDVELEYDPPFDQDLCGSCTACLEACPTGAIVDDYVLDANRCISYLTIEHRGDFPATASGDLHGWIYGCDICQEVCPWNKKFSRPSREEAFAPRPGMVDRSEKDWEGLTPGEYERIFRHSPMKRARFSGLKRNVRANLLSRASTGST